MSEEKNYDFLHSIDDKIQNSLSSTSLAFQQTFLSKSMPDLQAIKPVKNKSVDEDGEILLPEIASTSNGVIDAQSLMNRRKSFGDINDIKFFDSEYGHEAKFQPELHQGVNRLMIKKRSILNEIVIPQHADNSSRKTESYYQQENDVSNKRNSNLKELTDLMAKKSPRKLTIAEEYQKFQIETKMQKDIQRAQSISNSTLQEKLDACQSHREGLDVFDSFRANNSNAQPSAPTYVTSESNVDSRRNLQEENDRLLQSLKEGRNNNEPAISAAKPIITGFTKSYEPEDHVPQYSNREEIEKEKEKQTKANKQTESNKEKEKDQNSYYPIKLYVKQPKQKDRLGKKNNPANNKNKNKGSYAVLANKRSVAKKQTSSRNTTAKQNPATNKKSKRKVQSAGVEGKVNAKPKMGETRNEVRSAMESTGPFCKCSDEEDEEYIADAKHSLDYPIMKPVLYNGNLIFNGGLPQDAEGRIPPQQQYYPGMFPNGYFMPPQAFQQQDMIPSRSAINGNLYYQNDENGSTTFNKGYKMPSMSDSNNGRYGDCPLAQNYFNKFANVKSFQSEYLREINNTQNHQ
jgi:hypothetical protein